MIITIIIAIVKVIVIIIIIIIIISVKRWTDAEWPKQWYLNRGGALDMNVESAWDRGRISS